MTLQTFTALAEIVNALAVTATLIVLVVSIRQNIKAQRVLAVDALAASVTAINVSAMSDSKLGFALQKALADWNSASREERATAHFFLISYFKLAENGWYQYRAGTLEPGQWEGWDKLITAYYHAPGVQNVWWPARGHAYSPAFREYLANSKPPTDIGRLTDIFGS